MNKDKIKKEIKEKGYIKLGQMEDEVKLLSTVKDLEEIIDVEQSNDGWEGQLIKELLNGKKVMWWERWEKEESISGLSDKDCQIVQSAILELMKEEGYNLFLSLPDSLWFNDCMYWSDREGVVKEEAPLIHLLR